MKQLRSQYSVSRYFTPPRVEPLNLDLARLEGGGWAPAQFFGETHDGREVYIRYRGGGFSVTLGSASDPAGENRILDLTIGPPLDGGMLLGQLCHQFGITVNGKQPPFPTTDEMMEEGCRDLSGATTFYDVWLSSTFDTQKRFLTAALASLPHAALIQPDSELAPTKNYRPCSTIEDLKSDFACVVVGEPTAPETFADLRTDKRLWLNELGGSAVIRLTTAGFQFPMRKYDDRFAAHVQRVTDKKISVAGQIDECLHGSFSLHSQFRTDDSVRQALVQEVDFLLDQFFPAYEVAWFDLVTGAQVHEDSYVMPLDPAVADWVNAAPDRWLHIRNKGDQHNAWFVGARPIRAD